MASSTNVRPQAKPFYRLVTTILDPDRAPASELATLYAERREVAIRIKEIKIHQRPPPHPAEALEARELFPQVAGPPSWPRWLERSLANAIPAGSVRTHGS